MEILPELEESDLPDLGIKLLGHRKKPMKAIRLQGPSSKELAAAGTSQPAASAARSPLHLHLSRPLTKPDLNDTAVQPVAVAPRPYRLRLRPSTGSRKGQASRQSARSCLNNRQATSPVASAAAQRRPQRRKAHTHQAVKRSSIERIPAATDPNAAPTPKKVNSRPDCTGCSSPQEEAIRLL